MRKSDFEKLKKAQKKAIRKKEAEYTKENYKAYTVKWSYSKDQDILEFLDNYESPKALFTALIRKEMKRLERRQRREDAAL